jgi:hypothetical protein
VRISLYKEVDILLFLATHCSSLQWGRASDRLGRKPIIINGLLGASLSTILLGLSTSFPMLVLARCLSGALNGNVAIFKSVIGEFTDRTNAARAFSLLPLIWALGCTIGPLLGGYLSQPAKKYPSLFATSQNGPLALFGLWEHYPYFLPCAVSALITLTSVTLGFFFLEETLPSKVAEKKARAERKNAAASDQTALLSHSSSQQSEYGSTSAALHSTEGTESPTSKPPAVERPSFARDSPKKYRRSLAHVQSWTSGFTPTQSRHSSPAPGEERERRGTSTLQQSNSDQDTKAEIGVIGLLKIAHIRKIMISYAFLSLTSVALDAVQVLYFVSAGDEVISFKRSTNALRRSGSLSALAGYPFPPKLLAQSYHRQVSWEYSCSSLSSHLYRGG